MASWQAKPAAIKGEWTCFRQTDLSWPPLYHDTASTPLQDSGRWHREGEGYAQYMSLSALGAWAEYARYGSIRNKALAPKVKRDLWVVFVRESHIADLSTFDKYEACGLDPVIAVQLDRAPAQALADDLRAEGFRGILSPSAALPNTLNLTIFGERYEKELRTDLAAWRNPDPDSWLPVQIASRRGPMPEELCTETVFEDKKHESYRDWLISKRRPLPADPP